MFFFRDVSEFSHASENHHLRLRLHVCEVVQRRRHRCRVGVVCVNNQAVVGGYSQLRAVVRRYVALQCVADVVVAYPEVCSDGSRSQHVADVVVSYEMRLHAVCVPSPASPFEGEERFTLYHPAFYVSVRRTL